MKFGRMKFARTAVALLAASTFVLAGCGGDDDSSGGPDSQNVAGGSSLDATWPLTGLPVSGNQSASKERPVLVTKMDNTASSAPQLGLSKADLVVEELVEGGLTRLAAFYYSELPGKVGPVRSMRASDIGIVAPVDADVVTSGAAGKTIARINKAGIKFFQEGSAGLARDSSRPAPYNLMADLATVARKARQKAARPDDYLPWGDESDFAKKGPVANKIAAVFGGGHTTNWSYTKGAGTYTNLNTFSA